MTDGKQDIDTAGKKGDGIGMTLFGLYFVFLFMACVIIGRIVYIQLFYKPESVYMEKFTPASRKVVIEPERGAILSHDGRILAASTPKYQIAMDCTVRKREFAGLSDRNKGERCEAEWMGKARKLAAGLAEIYGDRTAAEYYRMIAEARRNYRQYIRIGGLIDHETLQKVKALPLFEEGPNKGGILIEKTLVEMEENRKVLYDMKVALTHKNTELIGLEKLSSVQELLEKAGSDLTIPDGPAIVIKD